MVVELLIFGLLAFALGFKHSYDADHLVAVSNLLTKSESLRKTSYMSIAWAAGHMATATVITVILFALREVLFTSFLRYFELVVAIMLIVLGVVGLLVEFDVLHWHGHQHGNRREHAHTHFHLRRLKGHQAMFGIGIVHGLASNDELLFLFVAGLGVTSLAGILGGVGIFSLGVVLGMVLFGVAVSYPVLRWGTARVRRVVSVMAAALSFAYAVYLLLRFEGLNPIPLG